MFDDVDKSPAKQWIVKGVIGFQASFRYGSQNREQPKRFAL